MGVLIGNVARKERRDTAALWASNNPVPLAGEWCLETDTGNVKIGDGVLTWNVLSYVNQIVQTFDISAGNQTMTLPKITGYPQEYNFFWTGGDGTFTATLAVTNAETVGGLLASAWPGEGKGSGSFVSNGTNWEVKVFNDYGIVSDSGSDTDRKWWKYADRTMKQIGLNPITLVASSSFIEVVTFGKAFAVAPKVSPDALTTYGINHFLAVGVRVVPSTTNVTIGGKDTDATVRSGTWDMTYTAIGPW